MLATAVGASGVCAAWLSLFPDRFERGATLSGLNPDGGGPGFLLILSSGVLSLLLKPKHRVGHDAMGWTARLVDASLTALLTGVLSFVIIGVLPALSGIEREPVVSAIAASVFVPRVIAAVLEPIWSDRDQSGADTPPPEGATGPDREGDRGTPGLSGTSGVSNGYSGRASAATSFPQ